MRLQSEELSFPVDAYCAGLGRSLSRAFRIPVDEAGARRGARLRSRRSGRAPFGSACRTGARRDLAGRGQPIPPLRSARRLPAGGRRSPAWLGATSSAGQCLSHGGRDLVAVDGERAVGVGASSLSPRKLAPGSARLGPSEELMCWGRRCRSSAMGGPVAERVMGRGRSSGHRGRGRGNRRFVARVGSRRRAPVDRWSAACVSQSRRSGARSVSKIARFLWGRFARQARYVGLPPRFCCVPKPGRPAPQRRPPTFFRRCRGCHFVTGASAGSLFLAPDIFASRSKKVGVSPSSAPLRPAPPPDGRRPRVQARSHGQAFRDRTEGNKPASGRRNPRPRKSGSRP